MSRFVISLNIERIRVNHLSLEADQDDSEALERREGKGNVHDEFILGHFPELKK